MEKTTTRKESRLTEAEMCQLLGVTKGRLRWQAKHGFIPKPNHTNKGPRYELDDERRSKFGIRPVGMLQRIIVGGEA